LHNGRLYRAKAIVCVLFAPLHMELPLYSFCFFHHLPLTALPANSRELIIAISPQKGEVSVAFSGSARKMVVTIEGSLLTSTLR